MFNLGGTLNKEFTTKYFTILELFFDCSISVSGVPTMFQFNGKISIFPLTTALCPCRGHLPRKGMACVLFSWSSVPGNNRMRFKNLGNIRMCSAQLGPNTKNRPFLSREVSPAAKFGATSLWWAGFWGSCKLWVLFGSREDSEMRSFLNVGHEI